MRCGYVWEKGIRPLLFGIGLGFGYSYSIIQRKADHVYVEIVRDGLSERIQKYFTVSINEDRLSYDASTRLPWTGE